uniref:Ycf20 n=1 Tax=Hemiselmis tepida TaxID=464990 RepID=A0A7S0YQT1_9CRYP|mmetsp:Transcript_14661/g.37348  ORF Transcript_14661/g.37348 Transcript_14661/m.37348 type:complete len:147 (+) Transcript_14661:41-481(+)
MIVLQVIQGKKFSKRSIFWRKKFQNATLDFKIFQKKFFNRNIPTFMEKKNVLSKNWQIFKNNWIWELSIGIFFLFFGFFSATSAITIIGSVADWDPLAAAVLLCWIELFTKLFYNSEKMSHFLKLLNSFKIGIILGMFVDAFKLTG